MFSSSPPGSLLISGAEASVPGSNLSGVRSMVTGWQFTFSELGGAHVVAQVGYPPIQQDHDD